MERAAGEEEGRKGKEGDLMTNRGKRQNDVECMTEGHQRYPQKSVPGPKTTLSWLISVLFKLYLLWLKRKGGKNDLTCNSS